jgi:gamma-glutamyltranspeptidase/glutathione hydrolase
MSIFSKKTAALVVGLLILATGFGGAQASLSDALKSYRPPITARDYMVETNNPDASMAGLQILQKGGNAFDAAVAVAAALSVSEPYLSNIFGGDAFIIIYSAKDKKVLVVNASGWAPTGATKDFYLAKGGIPGNGILSVEIPGAFSGWMQLLQKYGSMTPAQVFQPAIELCEKGRIVTPFFANSTGANTLKKFNDEAKAIFSKNGEPLPVGSVIYQKDLAKTFRTLGAAGWAAEDAFYRGEFAQKIAAFSAKNGGLLTYSDFADYRAEIVEPLTTNYQGYDVYACPPGCQGFVQIEALNILEPWDVKSLGLNSTKYVNLIIEALNLSLDDRNSYLGDTRFVDVPVKGLTSKAYAKERGAGIQLGKTLFKGMAKGLPEKYDTGNTTFFSVVDKDRNVVACTTSILDSYGSGLIAGDTGIFLNNRMAYFWLDANHPNVVQPRKRTMQTITPGIVLKGGKPYMAYGTPGADVQEQTKLQIFFNVIYFGMNPQQAIESPRFRSDNYPAASFPHTAYPGRIRLESRISQKVIDELKAIGYDVGVEGEWTTGMGGAGMILIDPVTNMLSGGVDPRREGYVLGW